MSALHLPRPDNLRSRFGSLVEADVYHICDRVKELDPNLYIYALEHAGKHRFAIIERCADGVERLVFRTENLDGRVIDHLRFLLHVPFEQRFAEAERIAEQNEKDTKAQDLDDLYEKLGRPMWRQLEHDGFIETRGVSFPKSGVSGGRGSKRRAA